MAARITWLLLWPVLGAAAFFGLIVVALTCGDDGPADYGEPDAIAFCRDSGLRDRLNLLAFIPLAVLAVGVLLLRSPDRLRWLNRIAFAMSGLVLAITMTQVNENGLAVIVVVAWSAVLVVEAFVHRAEPPKARTTNGGA